MNDIYNNINTIQNNIRNSGYGRMRETKKQVNCSSFLLFRNHNPHDKIDQYTGKYHGKKRSQSKNQSNNSWVNIHVIGNPATYSSQHSVTARTSESFRRIKLHN